MFTPLAQMILSMGDARLQIAERERVILQVVAQTGFARVRDIEANVAAAAATLRRDLARLERIGLIVRVHGGAKLGGNFTVRPDIFPNIAELSLKASNGRQRLRKQRIGQAAAALCDARETVMIDGGSTTLEMCHHLAEFDLNVLTNSLQIASALLRQRRTQIHFVSGTVFRDGAIAPASAGDNNLPCIHAPKLFMGAEAICGKGVVQSDTCRNAAVRPLIDRAEQIIVLADSSKFRFLHGATACKLEEIDVLVTDAGITGDVMERLRRAGIRVIVV